MAAIVGLPAGGSLVAATNYYQRCISSTSSTSSLISSPTGMTPLTEEAQHKAGVLGVVTNSQITCVSWEMVISLVLNRQHTDESSNTGPADTRQTRVLFYVGFQDRF
uniref:Uncharacterized protein n=1 Tax=Haplochromis burtoni TaxID=8153 RepID=A0A3Q2VRT1_HAPBU